MMIKSNDFKRIIFIILFSILALVLYEGITNAKETQQKGNFVNVIPIKFHVTHTSHRGVFFTFKYKNKIHKRIISYEDYNKIKKYKKVQMFYFENNERVSFDLNTIPNANAKFEFWDYLLVVLPFIGVFYNLYLLRRK